MDLNSIFSIYGNRMPIHYVHEVDSKIIEMTFALCSDPSNKIYTHIFDDFKLIERGIACDWSIVQDKGWGSAIVERDRIFRKLNTKEDHEIVRTSSHDDTAWAQMKTVKQEDRMHSYCIWSKSQTCEYTLNEKGQILSRIVKLNDGTLIYWAHNRYEYNNEKSYHVGHRSSICGWDQDTKTKKINYVYGEPKQNYHARSTKRYAK